MVVVRHERRDAAAHRRAILSSAQQLFATEGIDAVSMRQIAAAAGIGQGTLYRCYMHKGALCFDIMQERHEFFVASLAEHFTATASQPALVQLDGLFVLFIQFLEEQGALLSTIAASFMPDRFCHEAAHGREMVMQSPLHMWLNDLVVMLLNQAIARNELLPFDVLYTTDALLAALHPMLYRYQRQVRGFSSERILQGIRHLYLSGVPSTQT